MNKIFIILIFLLCSCGKDKTNSNTSKRISLETSSIDINEQSKINDKQKLTTPTEFFIKDTTKYSTEFLKEFKKRHSSYKTVSLIDDSIIINNDRKNFIRIPTDLPLNKEVIYKTEEKATKYSLTIKRINFSTIEYNFSQDFKGQKSYQRQGQANLEPVFYFGAEGTFEDDEGDTFGMNEYIDNSEKNCWTNVYVGIGSIEKSFLIHRCERDKEKLKTPELKRIR